MGAVMRTNVEAERLIDVKHSVLDLGFVTLLDYMGTDSAIVQAARTSTGGCLKTYAQDKKLIRYLMQNRHTSPFEMCELKFLVKLPIFVMRQWVRHRTANINEWSGRYAQMPNDLYVPSHDLLKAQSETNKQVSEGDLPLDLQRDFRNDVAALNATAYGTYQTYLENGMARETARIVLPLSAYTLMIWKCDLHNILHFLKLRLAKNAQSEIRSYAETIGQIVKMCYPITWEAFEEYVLNARTLSASQIVDLRHIMEELKDKPGYKVRVSSLLSQVE